MCRRKLSKHSSSLSSPSLCSCVNVGLLPVVPYRAYMLALEAWDVANLRSIG